MVRSVARTTPSTVAKQQKCMSSDAECRFSYSTPWGNNQLISDLLLISPILYIYLPLCM